MPPIHIRFSLDKSAVNPGEIAGARRAGAHAVQAHAGLHRAVQTGVEPSDHQVADLAAVTSHEAWGLGAYCFFDVDPSVVAERGFEAPVNPNVRFHDLLTVSLGGNGTINRVINNTGGPAQGTDTIPVKVVTYP